MNYTNPNDENHEDKAADWLACSLIFARALGFIFKEGEGIVIDATGDLKELFDNKYEKLIVYYLNEQIKVEPTDRENMQPGDWVNVLDLNGLNMN